MGPSTWLPGDAQLVRRQFADHGLATDLPSTATSWSIEKLLDSMHRDKKAEGGHLVFVLARGIGEAFVARDVTADAVRPVLADALQRAKG